MVDNLDNPEDPDIERLMTLPLKVIANSRIGLDGFEVHSLGFLTLLQCRKLFYRYYKGPKNDQVADRIIKLCGYHTLTVELLARTARNAGKSLEWMEQALIEKGFNLNKVIRDKVGTFWHDKKNKELFFDHLLTLFDLAGVTPEEEDLIMQMSVLPVMTPIPMDTIKKWLKLDSNDAVNGLVFKGWLMRENHEVFMHPVVSEVIRFKTKPMVEKCRPLINSLGHELYTEPAENPLNKKEIVVLARSVLDHLYREGEEYGPEQKNGLYEDLSASANNLSVIYQNLGQLEQALEFQKKALHIKEQILDSEHPDLARSYNTLSLIYYDLGQLEQTLKFQKKALHIREQILTPIHLDLAISYSSLSLTYQALGKMELALELQKKASNIFEEILAPDHPDLAMAYNNLSIVYHGLGQLEQALEFQKRAIQISEPILTQSHPSLALFYNNLSLIYESLGQLEQALELQKKVVQIREEVLGSKHPNMAQSYHNLSAIYASLMNYVQARQYAQKAMEIMEHLFPDGHPNLTKVKRNLKRIIQEEAESRREED